jgi:hypothetical protein
MLVDQIDHGVDEHRHASLDGSRQSSSGIEVGDSDAHLHGAG